MKNTGFSKAMIIFLDAVSCLMPAWGGPIQMDPDVACNIMANSGLRTRGGYRETAASFHCRSQWRAATGGSRSDNSIRFLARGNRELVTQLSLELRVNARTGIQRAHRSLAEHAHTLIKNTLETLLKPSLVRTNSKAGRTVAWVVVCEPETMP